MALQSPPAMNTENSTFEPFINPTTWFRCILYHSPKFSEFPEIHSTKNKQMARTPRQYINPYVNLDPLFVDHLSPTWRLTPPTYNRHGNGRVSNGGLFIRSQWPSPCKGRCSANLQILRSSFFVRVFLFLILSSLHLSFYVILRFLVLLGSLRNFILCQNMTVGGGSATQLKIFVKRDYFPK